MKPMMVAVSESLPFGHEFCLELVKPEIACPMKAATASSGASSSNAAPEAIVLGKCYLQCYNCT